jgi:uncharacterized membrane protein (DUF4010 family)
MLGGLISSTNVTLTFARLSRREPTLAGPLATGAIAGCTVLFPRVMIAACVLNLTVARLLLPYLVAPFLIGVASLTLRWRKKADSVQEPEGMANPLQIGPALQMAAMFQIVLFAVSGVSRAFGDGGLRIAGAVLGLTDVDALTISMTASAIAGTAPSAAAAAIAIGVVTNCLMKAAMAVVLGTPAFRRITAGVLVAMATTVVVALRVMS